jgi:hypothetical protein
VRVRRYCSICRADGPWTEVAEDGWHREILAQVTAHDVKFHPVVEPVQLNSRRAARPARKAAA